MNDSLLISHAKDCWTPSFLDASRNAIQKVVLEGEKRSGDKNRKGGIQLYPEKKRKRYKKGQRNIQKQKRKEKRKEKESP